MSKTQRLGRTFEVRCGQCGRFITGLLTPLPPPTEQDAKRGNESGVQLFGIQRGGPLPESLDKLSDGEFGRREKGCDNCLGVHGGAEISYKIAKQKVNRLEAEIDKLKRAAGQTPNAPK